MNVERLTRLADLMDEVHEKGLPFSMEAWVYLSTPTGELAWHTGHVDLDKPIRFDAFSYAAMDDWFISRGFCLGAVFTDDSGNRTLEYMISPSEVVNAVNSFKANGEFTFDFAPSLPLVGKLAGDAIATFFEISRTEAAVLYYVDENYSTAKDVANRIRIILTKGWEALLQKEQAK